MNLSEISTASKESLLQKMDINTITRFRLMNRSSDKYVEQARFRLKSRCRNNSLVLTISITTDIEAGTSKPTLSFCVTLKKVGRLFAMQDLTDIPSDSFVRMHDPYKQLSAINFDFIILEYPENDFTGTADEIERAKGEQKRELDKIIPSLERLHLSSKWLCINSEEKVVNIERVLNLITFENIIFQSPCSPEEMEFWPIKHCMIADFVELESVPIQISLTFRACISAGIGAYSGEIDEDVRMDRLIRDFLKEIRRSRRARGNLKKITFEMQESLLKISDFPELVLLYKGFDQDDPATVSKLKIEDGFAYIYFCDNYCEFRIVEEEEDEEVIASIKEDFSLRNEISFMLFIWLCVCAKVLSIFNPFQ